MDPVVMASHRPGMGGILLGVHDRLCGAPCALRDACGAVGVSGEVEIGGAEHIGLAEPGVQKAIGHVEQDKAEIGKIHI